MATLFYNPMTLPSCLALWLVIPLCVAVAVVYKTIRTDDVGKLHFQAIKLVGYILVGMVALGAGLYLIQEYWP